MNRFEDMMEKRSGSPEWDKSIARGVLNKKAKLNKRNLAVIFSAAASFALIVSAGLFYQVNQKPSLESTFDEVLAETVSTSNENTVISSDMDDKIIQYCMNIKQ